jgi:phosphoglycerate-specific signal transduction histidine kinase
VTLIPGLIIIVVLETGFKEKKSKRVVAQINAIANLNGKIGKIVPPLVRFAKMDNVSLHLQPVQMNVLPVVVKDVLMIQVIRPAEIMIPTLV